jgi:hypothetical protein
MSSSPGWDEGNSGLELIEADEPGGATDAAPGASDSIVRIPVDVGSIFRFTVIAAHMA